MIVIAMQCFFIYPFGLANYIDLSSVGVMLCDGFNLAVLNPSDIRGHDTYCITAIKDKTMGFIYIS